MALNIQKASKFEHKTYLVLSRDTDKALSEALRYIETVTKNPLVVAFGSPERFADTPYDVAFIEEVSGLADNISEINTKVKNGSYDGVLVDSITLLRRLMNADIADGGAPSIQDYGIINNRLINALKHLKTGVPVFVTTGAFVMDEQQSKTKNRTVWELDFTSSLSASIFPQFGSIVYVATDGSVVTDRQSAISGKEVSVSIGKSSRSKLKPPTKK